MLIQSCAETPSTVNQGANGREKLVSLDHAAKLVGVCKNTLRAYTNKGILPDFRSAGGYRRFRESDLLKLFKVQGPEVIGDTPNEMRENGAIPIAVKIRVSGQSQKESLELQEQRVLAWVKDKFPNAQITIYKSIGSGLNFARKPLIKLIGDILDGKFRGGYLVAENFNRVCRYGIQLIEKICEVGQCQLIYSMPDAGDSESLADEIVAILNVFTAKANGKKAKLIKQRKLSDSQIRLILKLHLNKYSLGYTHEILKKRGMHLDLNGKSVGRSVIHRVVRENAKLLQNKEFIESLNSEQVPTRSTPPNGESSNSFIQFLKASVRVSRSKSTKLLGSILFDSYERWCNERGLVIQAARRERSHLLLQQFPNVQKSYLAGENRSRQRAYLGIELKPGREPKELARNGKVVEAPMLNDSRETDCTDVEQA